MVSTIKLNWTELEECTNKNLEKIQIQIRYERNNFYPVEITT